MHCWHYLAEKEFLVLLASSLVAEKTSPSPKPDLVFSETTQGESAQDFRLAIGLALTPGYGKLSTAARRTGRVGCAAGGCLGTEESAEVSACPESRDSGCRELYSVHAAAMRKSSAYWHV